MNAQAKARTMPIINECITKHVANLARSEAANANMDDSKMMSSKKKAKGKKADHLRPTFGNHLFF